MQETKQLKKNKLALQFEIQRLIMKKTNLQGMLDEHKCNMNNESQSNSVSSVNHTSIVLDSNAIPDITTSVLSNNVPTTKRNLSQQQNINTNLNGDNNSNSGSDISIQCEDIDNKNNTGNSSINEESAGNSSPGVILDFDFLVNDITGLYPISTDVGNV